MAYSTLTALANDSILVDGEVISSGEMNSHRTLYRGLSNSLFVENKAHETHRASSTEPTDKPEGTAWCDTTLDPAQLKFYKDGAGNLFTLASLEAANAFTGANTFTGTTLNGVSTFAVGSAAAPPIIFTGDPDTGIYHGVADQVNFSTGGVQRGAFSASGLEVFGGIRSDSGGTGEFVTTLTKEIGDWNMDADTSVSVAHGLTLAKIRDFWAIVRNDADTAYDHLLSKGSTSNAGDVRANTTNIELSAFTGGFFDNTNYNATAFNRGWVYIKYAI